jgi:putative peptidoglycan lipid II flippase
MDKKLNLLKPILQITFFSIIGIIFGFLAQLVIAYYFGAKFERDAFFVAAIIPTYVSSVFTGSFGIIFLPKVIDILKRKKDESLSVFLGSTFCFLAIILLLLTIGCVIFSYYVIQMIAPGYSHEQAIFTGKLLKIVVPSILFIVLGNLLGSLYQIQHKFIRPALAPIISVTCNLLLVIILSNQIGVYSLAIGSLFGSFISFFFMLPVLKDYSFKLGIDLKNIDNISFIRSLTPLLLTGIIFRATGVIERIIASNLPQGSISYLGYTNQLLIALGTLTTNGIAISTYPALSRLWSDNNKIDFTNVFTKTIRLLLLLSIPISLSIIFFSSTFIKIIFERGAFTSANTLAVSNALIWSMGAFIFQGLGGVVAKILYISNKTIISSTIAILEIIIYFILGFILSKYYSYIGLSISLSVSSMINILLSMYFIHKSVVRINFSILLKELMKVIVVSSLAVLCAFIFFKSLKFSLNNNINIVLSLIIELITFYYLAKLIKIEEIEYLQNFIKKKLKND